DTVETPQDYRDVIARMRARSLPMICANPDEVVERGDKLIYCAGAIADLYAAAGGEVVYAGKPHRPSYQQGLALSQTPPRGPVATPACGGEGRWGAHRSKGRRRLRHRLLVRDRGHPRGGARQPPRSRRRGAGRHLRGGGGRPQGGDAPAQLVVAAGRLPPRRAGAKPADGKPPALTTAPGPGGEKPAGLSRPPAALR